MKKRVLFCLGLIMSATMLLNGCGEKTDDSGDETEIQAESSTKESKKETLTEEEKYCVDIVNQILDEIDDPSTLKVYSISGSTDIDSACLAKGPLDNLSEPTKYVARLDVSYSNEQGGTERYKTGFSYVASDIGFSESETDVLVVLNEEKLTEMNVDKILENSDYYKYVKQ